MSQHRSTNQESANLLYSLACKLLACHLMMYYVLDEEFTQEAGVRFRAWLPLVARVVDWLEQDKYRNGALIDSNVPTTEPVIDGYLETAHSVLADAANRLTEIHAEIPRHLWFYFLYTKWFLGALRAFQNLVDSVPIVESDNHEVYLANRQMFQALMQVLEHEHPDVDALHIPAERKADTEEILVTTADDLVQLWQQTLLATHRSVLEGN